MQSLRDKNGSDSGSEEQDQTGGFGFSAEEKQFYKELIEKANTVPIKNVIALYKIRVDDSNKISCPFQRHKMGRENTPSLYVYPQTNTFWCFGCKTGRTPTDFVANISNLSKIKAAQKIVENSDDFSIFLHNEDYAEKLDLIVDFSKSIRDIMLCDPNKAEEICFIFDKMNSKHNLSNEQLKQFLIKLNNKYKYKD